MLKLYENIRELRKLNKWTQEDLATRMGYTDRSMIAKIESGKVDLSQSKILEFARVFNIEPGDLMGWDGDPEEQTTYGRLIEAYVYRERLNDYTPEQIIKALDFLDAFQAASPEAKAAVEILLKSRRSDP